MSTTANDPKRIFTDHAIETGDASILTFAIGRAIIVLCGDRQQAIANCDKQWEDSATDLIATNEELRDRMMAETDAYEATSKPEAPAGGEPNGESEGD